MTVVRPLSEIPLKPSVRERVQLVEIRLDRFAPNDWKSTVTEAARFFPRARFLLTIRFARDGGAWPDDVSRAEAFAQAFALRQWDYVDFEWNAFDLDALLPLLALHRAWTRLVCSRHDFTPPRAGLEATLGDLWRTARSLDASVAKWAGTLADPEREAADLCSFAALHADDSLVPAVFAMGPEAQVTRVAAPLLGGGWSYGHDGVGAAAPGQIPWPVLSTLLQSVPRPETFSREWLMQVDHALHFALRQI